MFIREYRYMVFKLTDIKFALTRDERDLLEHLMGKAHGYRRDCGKRPFECIVVESDWPEYEPTWEAIEKRMMEEKP